MRKFFIFLSIIIIIQYSNYSILRAEDCGITTNCPSMKYAYHLCNTTTNETIVECIEDLSQLPSGYTVLTLPLPICVIWEYDENMPSEYTIGNETHYNAKVFKNQYSVIECMETPYIWNCLCGRQNDPCTCTLKVKLSDDYEDFTDEWWERDVAETIAAARIPWSNCEINCKSSEINFNNTVEFTGAAPESEYKYRNFFINDEYMQTPGYLDRRELERFNYKVYNFKEILLHEIGHFLGLEHHTYVDRETKTEISLCDNGDYEVRGLMNACARDYHGKYQGVNDDDICQFKRLHCPDLTGVDDYYTNKDKKSKPFPNPSEDVTNISFSLNSYSETTILYVYNYLGNTVKILELMNLDFSNEEHIIQIPTNDLAPGQYFYKIVNETTVETGKFIIVR